MNLRVVGAGLGRTGTMSLKLALEQLLGGSCYHMLELFGRPIDLPGWHAAIRGEPCDWDFLLEDFVATVDWPACAFWRDLSEVHPGATILLSTRPAEDWWESCDRTIFEVFKRPDADRFPEWHAMAMDMFARTFTPDFLDRDAAIAAYERHNEDVRATADPDRLVEWHPGDGWGPLCAALGVPLPAEEFPHANTTAEFRARAGFDV